MATPPTGPSITIDATDPVLEAINQLTVTNVQQAVAIMQSTTYNITDPATIAAYLWASKFNTSNANSASGDPNANKTNGGGLNLGSALQIPVAAGSIAAMAGIKAGSSVMPMIGATGLAAIANYMVFDRAEKAAENDSGFNIGMLGLIVTGAIFATMLWLTKLSNYKPTTGSWTSPDVTNFSFVIKAGQGKFTINPTLPHFWLTFGIASAIVGFVTTLAILIAKKGSTGAPMTANGAAIQSFMSLIPRWYGALPKMAMGTMMAGLTIGGMSFQVTPSQLYMPFFNAPTVDVVNGLATATGQDGASQLGKVLVQQGAGPNGADIVTMTMPNPDGTTSGMVFALDANGYIVGKNGPNTNYLPFFQPVIDGKGNVTGYKQNYGALNALLQVPACMAIAEDKTRNAQQREAAMETCLRNNKQVDFIPTGT